MANELNLATVIEGIKTTEPINHSRNVGAQHGQGHVWGPALPAGKLTSLVAATRRLA